MRRPHLALLAVLALFIPAIAAACLWDRDTLRSELHGLPGTAETIFGRFDRFPPKYYEMRLTRVRDALAHSPDNLDLYDDAGVAADRLKRSDEAIAWMVQKRTALDRLAREDPKRADHDYRYLANLGTFHAHRWVRAGAARRSEDLQRASDLLKAAIQLNPNAHFGRERYQLMAIDWLLAQPPLDSHPLADNLFWSARERLGDQALGLKTKALAAAGMDDAVKGLAGLIVLGDAWESTDILYALALALNDAGKGNLAAMASARVLDLAGSRQGQPLSLNSRMAKDFGFGPMKVMGDKDLRTTTNFLHQGLRDAAAWRRSRNDYLLSRLAQGQHPDTHPDFWSEFSETPFSWPTAPTLSVLIAAFAVGWLSVGAILVRLRATLAKARASGVAPDPERPSTDGPSRLAPFATGGAIVGIMAMVWYPAVDWTPEPDHLFGIAIMYMLGFVFSPVRLFANAGNTVGWSASRQLAFLFRVFFQSIFVPGLMLAVMVPQFS